MVLRSRTLIRELLEVRQVSEREVARAAGLSHSTVNHLVTGRRSSCSRRTAEAIAAQFGCRTDVLFQEAA